MYEALYRKYRPKSFDDVVGQEYITGTLKNQVQTGRLSHAYLFIGTRGTGKTTCARILAKAVNCEHPVDGNPCNECAACRGIEDGTILDVVELDAASNNGVDDVRMLRDEAIFSPTTVRKRVYIIDEVHMLSKPAFNALLKILEEPPQHLMFILATTELNKVLPTILSRCQRHSFRRLDGDTIAKRLSYVAEKEGIRLEEDAAQLLGRLADGGMRDGLSLLDQCSSAETVDTSAVLHAMGLAGSYRTKALADCIISNDIAAALDQFESLWQDGKEPSALLSELAGFFREALLLRLSPGSGKALISGAYEESALRGIRVGDGTMLWILNTIQKYQSVMRDSSNPRLTGELCLAELCGMRPNVQTIPASIPAALSVPEPIGDLKPQSGFDDPAEMMPWGAAQESSTVSANVTVPKETTQKTEAAAEQEKQAFNPGAISWQDVLKASEKDIPIGTYVLLSDDMQVRGEVNGNELLLRITPGFTMTAINTPDVVNTLRQCASRLSGSPIQVRLEALKPGEGLKESKLDFLGQFGNVTIR